MSSQPQEADVVARHVANLYTLAEMSSTETVAVGQGAGLERAKVRVWESWVGRALVVLCSVVPLPTSGQVVAELDPQGFTFADSVGIWSAVVGAVVAEFGPRPEIGEQRVWIPAAHVESPVRPYREGSPAIPLSLQQALQNRHSSIRFVEDWKELFETLFECPEGVRVRMPGSGCPIRESGFVVMLGRLWRDDAGELWTQASVTRSDPVPESDATDTWMRGFRLRLEQSEEGAWTVVETTPGWTT